MNDSQNNRAIGVILLIRKPRLTLSCLLRKAQRVSVRAGI